jgi:hypothetical protein
MENSNVLSNGLIKIKDNRYVSVKGSKTVFYSYFTPVIVIVDDRVYRTSQFYSVTTSRHINRFLKDYFYPAKFNHVELLDQDTINHLAE